MYDPKIPLTEKEKQAIEKYTGYNHMMINLIADMRPEKYGDFKKSGKIKDISLWKIEELIEDFVNLYTAIYKQGNIESTGTLYRGIEKKEVDSLRKNEEIKNFISTSREEQIAQTFGDVITRIKCEKGLPHLYIEPFKENDKRDEKEVLILPFTKVIAARTASNGDREPYHDVVLQKGELLEVEANELETLKKQCIEDFSLWGEQIKQYNFLGEEYKELSIQSKKEAKGREEVLKITKRKIEKGEQCYQIYEKIDEYRKKFDTMLKGMCRQKEKDIDKQKEDIVEQQRKEQEKAEKEKREKVRTELNQQLENLENTLDFNIEQLIKNANRYQEEAEELGVSYTQSIPNKLLEMVELIKQELEKRKNFESKEEYTVLRNEKQKLEEIEREIKALPSMISSHERQSRQEIKFHLNLQVREMIYKTRKQRLEKEKNTILQKKDTILQRIIGRNRIKEAELKNVEARLELAENDFKTMNPENKEEEMLKNIYACAYEKGEFTQEMEDMIGKIRSHFNNLPNEQELKTNKELIPSEKKKSKNTIFFLGKRRILEVQNQTKEIEEKSRQAMARKKRGIPMEMNVLSEIERKMEDIYHQIRKEDYYEQEKEKEEEFVGKGEKE